MIRGLISSVFNELNHALLSRMRLVWRLDIFRGIAFVA